MDPAAAGSVKERCERLIKDLRRRESARIEIQKAPREQVPARGGDKSLIEDPVDAPDAIGAVRRVAVQELQDLHDVRRVPFCERRRHAPADEDPQGPLDVERPEGIALLTVEPLLLKEREQTGHQVQLQVVLMRALVEIENLVVLAETVRVEIAVRVVAQRAPRVQLRQLGTALDGLPEGGRVLEGEPLVAQRIAETHPRAFVSAAGAAVPFVHQHQVVALEGVDGHGPFAHLVTQAGHFEDLHSLSAEQPAAVLVEQFGLYPRCFELAQMLLRQPSLGVSRRTRFNSSRLPCRVK